MAIDTAVCCVNVLALFEHSRLRTGINVRPLFVRFRIEMSDLPRRDDSEPDPRKRERAEDSEKERSKPFHARLNSAVCRPPLLDSRKRGSNPFHQWPPAVSASTGFRNVGTVDVRPNPKSIRPK